MTSDVNTDMHNELLIRQMAKGECVLDPFSGSMTTGRTAHQHGVRSVSIEMQKEYCDELNSLTKKIG